LNSKDYASSRDEIDAVMYLGNISRRWELLQNGLTKWGQE
jgi:hypothetical protein